MQGQRLLFDKRERSVLFCCDFFLKIQLVMHCKKKGGND
ncbi:hypothetical protein BAME_03440 [Bacillus sp. M 2-6]|nr:hypothetical protein BAME_03440 [Bacillus sp. M 2-6]